MYLSVQIDEQCRFCACYTKSKVILVEMENIFTIDIFEETVKGKEYICLYIMKNGYSKHFYISDYTVTEAVDLVFMLREKDHSLMAHEFYGLCKECKSNLKETDELCT